MKGRRERFELGADGVGDVGLDVKCDPRVDEVVPGPHALDLLAELGGESLGRGYVSELARNFRPYDPL